jgi:hypothetical protein
MGASSHAPWRIRSGHRAPICRLGILVLQVLIDGCALRLTLAVAASAAEGQFTDSAALGIGYPFARHRRRSACWDTTRCSTVLQPVSCERRRTPAARPDPNIETNYSLYRFRDGPGDAAFGLSCQLARWYPLQTGRRRT